MVAVLETGRWFSGGCIFWVSDGCRDIFNNLTDPQKRKINPTASVIARIDVSGRIMCFRDDELPELVLLDE